MLKDNKVQFRCDDYEFSQIEALPFLLEEYIPGVSFNRSRALNYAVAFVFREVSNELYKESDSLKMDYKTIDDFRSSLLKRFEKKEQQLINGVKSVSVS